MALTQERAELLTKILTTDAERTRTLLALDAKEALTQINALGNDFTLEELSGYGEVMDAIISGQGELDANALDDVAGGLLSWKCQLAIALGGPIGALGVACYKLGQWAATP